MTGCTAGHVALRTSLATCWWFKSQHAGAYIAGTVTQPQAALYYAQRSTKGGLLITEATCIQVVSDGLCMCV